MGASAAVVGGGATSGGEVVGGGVEEAHLLWLVDRFDCFMRLQWVWDTSRREDLRCVFSLSAKRRIGEIQWFNFAGIKSSCFFNAVLFVGRESWYVRYGCFNEAHTDSRPQLSFDPDPFARSRGRRKRRWLDYTLYLFRKHSANLPRLMVPQARTSPVRGGALLFSRECETGKSLRTIDKLVCLYL